MKSRSALAASISLLLAPVAVVAQSASSVPPPKTQEDLRKQNKGEVPRGLEATGVVADIKSNMNALPTLTDAMSGEQYEKFLGRYGKGLDAVKFGTDIAKGYYRGGSEGMLEAEKDVLRDLATKGAVGFTAGVVAGAAAMPLAPLVAAGEAGIAVGNGINAMYGPQLTRGMFSAQDAYFDAKDKYIDEPARQQWAEELRAKHQAAKAQYENEAASRAAQQSYGSPSVTMSGGLESPMVVVPQSPVGTPYGLSGSLSQPSSCGYSFNCSSSPAGLPRPYSPPKITLPPTISTPAPAPAPAPAPSADHSASGIHQADGYCRVPHPAGQCPKGQLR